MPVSTGGAARIGITIDATLEVADQDIVTVAANQIFRQQRDLAATTRCIDDVLRDGITGRVTAQPLNNLDTLRDRCAEMRRTGDRIALIQIIRPDTAHQQTVIQFPHGFDFVVDAMQQYRLRTQRDTGVGKSGR